MPFMSRDRLYSDSYSSGAQLERHRDEYWRDLFTAQLRFDLLTTRVVITTDSHLLDGVNLLDMGPTALAQVLGRDAEHEPLPLIVRTRESTIEKSLAALLVRPDRPTLNGFPFKIFRDPRGTRQVADALQTRTAEDLLVALRRTDDAARGLGTFLRQLLKDEGMADLTPQVDAAEQGWARWVEAERQGRVRSARWNGTFDLAGSLQSDPIDPESELASDTGRRMYAQIKCTVARGEAHRSDFRSWLESELGGQASGPEVLDAITLENWYAQARHRAIARQHAAAFAHVSPTGGAAVGPYRRAAEDVPLDPALREGPRDGAAEVEDVLARLGELDSGGYRSLLRRTRPDRDEWITSGSRSALIHVFEKVTEPVTSPKYEGRDLVQLFAPTAANGALTTVIVDGWKGLVAAGGTFLISLCADRVGRRRPVRRIVEYIEDSRPDGVRRGTDRPGATA
ncbi:hypothetical protein [Blastococcus sp. SYSU DS0828]